MDTTTPQLLQLIRCVLLWPDCGERKGFGRWPVSFLCRPWRTESRGRSEVRSWLRTQHIGPCRACRQPVSPTWGCDGSSRHHRPTHRRQQMARPLGLPRRGVAETGTPDAPALQQSDIRAGRRTHGNSRCRRVTFRKRGIGRAAPTHQGSDGFSRRTFHFPLRGRARSCAWLVDAFRLRAICRSWRVVSLVEQVSVRIHRVNVGCVGALGHENHAMVRRGAKGHTTLEHAAFDLAHFGVSQDVARLHHRHLSQSRPAEHSRVPQYMLPFVGP